MCIPVLFTMYYVLYSIGLVFDPNVAIYVRVPIRVRVGLIVTIYSLKR
jgi:hypothetical protein